MNMKKSSVIVILIGVVIIIAVIGFVAFPAFTTSTLRIKYTSHSEIDKGNILILLDADLPYSSGIGWIHKEGHADQYTTFSGLSIGRHTINISTGVWGDWNGTLLARGNITSHAAILGDSAIDLQYGDGI